MPVKLRAAKERRRSFSAEALALFIELERTPQHSRKFKDGSRELARLLGLTAEWWTMNHVNDRSRAPCHPPGYIAREDWIKVRAVREALLAAARLEDTGHRQRRGHASAPRA
jgi:hypothetical protein